MQAAHLLSDIAGLLVSLLAAWLAGMPRTSRLSYGYRRADEVAAFVSVMLIWGTTVFLVIEAVQRIVKPQAVDGKIMFITGACGLAVNILMMKVLHQGHNHSHNHSHGGADEGGHPHHSHSHSHGGEGEGGIEDEGHGKPAAAAAASHHHGHSHENLNVRAAFIHAVGDLIQSIGVMIAAALIWWRPNWNLADPLCTIVFACLVVWSSWGTFRKVRYERWELEQSQETTKENESSIHSFRSCFENFPYLDCVSVSLRGG